MEAYIEGLNSLVGLGQEGLGGLGCLEGLEVLEASRPPDLHASRPPSLQAHRPPDPQVLLVQLYFWLEHTLSLII